MNSPALIAIALPALLTGGALGLLAGFLVAQWRAARSDEQQRDAFGSVARETLRANNEAFLQLARESLSREHVVSEKELKAREAAIGQLVEPLRAALERTEHQVQSLER